MIRDDRPVHRRADSRTSSTSARRASSRRPTRRRQPALPASSRPQRVDLVEPGAARAACRSRRCRARSSRASDAAGVITTRAAGEAFFSAGTNRRMWRFTAMNYLCRDMEQLQGHDRPADRIRQDVTRSPGGDSQIFHNTVRRLSLAAWTRWRAPTPTSSGTRRRCAWCTRPARCSRKYLINADVFPGGYVTIDDRWDNSGARGRTRRSAGAAADGGRLRRRRARRARWRTAARSPCARWRRYSSTSASGRRRTRPTRPRSSAIATVFEAQRQLHHEARVRRRRPLHCMGSERVAMRPHRASYRCVRLSALRASRCSARPAATTAAARRRGAAQSARPPAPVLDPTARPAASSGVPDARSTRLAARVLRDVSRGRGPGSPHFAAPERAARAYQRGHEPGQGEPRDPPSLAASCAKLLARLATTAGADCAADGADDGRPRSRPGPTRGELRQRRRPSVGGARRAQIAQRSADGVDDTGGERYRRQPDRALGVQGGHRHDRARHERRRAGDRPHAARRRDLDVGWGVDIETGSLIAHDRPRAASSTTAIAERADRHAAVHDRGLGHARQHRRRAATGAHRDLLARQRLAQLHARPDACTTTTSARAAVARSTIGGNGMPRARDLRRRPRLAGPPPARGRHLRPVSAGAASTSTAASPTTSTSDRAGAASGTGTRPTASRSATSRASDRPWQGQIRLRRDLRPGADRQRRSSRTSRPASASGCCCASTSSSGRARAAPSSSWSRELDAYSYLFCAPTFRTPERRTAAGSRNIHIAVNGVLAPSGPGLRDDRHAW